MCSEITAQLKRNSNNDNFIFEFINCLAFIFTVLPFKSCNHHNVVPGSYVIVPTTFSPNEESDFIVRVYTEKPADAA